ncbi:MAG: sulfite exporter TauE/SafE family protein [Planctomycetota bacterium]
MTDWPLAAAVFLVAAVYASVGHAGATGYIAVMTLWGLAPEVIRPTALVLNVIVATIGTVQFARAGHVDRRLLPPLVVASVPAAAVGGWLALPRAAFETLLGAVLAFAAIRLALEAVRQRHGPAPAGPSPRPPIDPGRAGVLGQIGGVVGLLSGLTGVGGGVFLTPLLLALRAAPVRTVAATSAAFILVNSLAGLAGGLAAGRGMPLPGVPLVAAAAAGGLVGSSLGAFRLPVTALTFLMAAVLAIAAAKSLL